MKREKGIASLESVTATGAGTDVDTRGGSGARACAVLVIASDVTTGGTVKVQGSEDQVNYFDLSTVTVSADGADEVIVEFPPTWVRANVTARTDGTYSANVHKIG